MKCLLIILQKFENWILSVVPQWMKAEKRDVQFVNGIKCGIMFTALFSSGVGFGIELKSWKYNGQKAENLDGCLKKMENSVN